MAPQTQGQYSQLGALFANHILVLGEGGFASWLVDAFGGSEINEKGDYFQYNVPGVEARFDEMMATVISEFEQDVLLVGSVATKDACNRITPSTSSEGRSILQSLKLLFSPFG